MQSLINASTADTIHFGLASDHRLIRNRRSGRHSHPGNSTLYGWFEAHSELASKIGFVFCVLFYGLTLAYGIVAGGHWVYLRQAAASATSDIAIAAGFEVKAVQLEGRKYIKQSDIAAALGPYEGQSIFAFDTARARQRLKRNGWIGEARVMRLLPATLIVELEERTPFALWHEGARIAVIDEDGRVLALASRSEFPNLPIVSGPGAAAPAKGIIEALAALPELKSRVQNIERIAGRRWDLVLDSGLRVKLPAEDFAKSMADLSAIAAKNPAAFYEISEMDFRVPSQFTVRLKDESENGRKKFLSWLSSGEESRSQGL